MEDKRKLTYLCAGVGAGAALGMLFAPKSGAQTRNSLRVAANEGVDQVKGRLREVQEVFDRRDEILQAGKDHLSSAAAAGRDAYRESVAPRRMPEMSSIGAIGLLAFEAAALVTAYKITRGLQGVAPKVEDFLHYSRAAVADASRQIAAITSAGRDILSGIETVMGTRRPG